MAAKDKKTEHSGAKKGQGAYWGKKKDAKKDSNRSRRIQDKREAKKRQDEGLDTDAIVEEAFEDEKKYPVKISYGAWNVFQTYWNGQGDPLYAVLSRRGTSPDWVTVEATEEEVVALFDLVEKIINDPFNDREETVALGFELNNMPLKRSLYDDSPVDEHNTHAVVEDAMTEEPSKTFMPGIDYDYDKYRHLRREVMIQSVDKLAADLLDLIFDPADVSDEEAWHVAEEIFNGYRGETLEVAELEKLAREYKRELNTESVLEDALSS